MKKTRRFLVELPGGRIPVQTPGWLDGDTLGRMPGDNPEGIPNVFLEETLNDHDFVVFGKFD